MKRVVVTGMAGITSLGSDWASIEANFVAGRSGIRRMDEWDRFTELNTRLAGSRNSLNLEDLKLGLDDTAFSGRFGIADFARQSLRAQLKGDKLDLDRYLPAKQADSASAAVRMRGMRLFVFMGTRPFR